LGIFGAPVEGGDVPTGIAPIAAHIFFHFAIGKADGDKKVPRVVFAHVNHPSNVASQRVHYHFSKTHCRLGGWE
jgi:hypothetical protein